MDNIINNKFPPLLREINDPPKKLYVRGKLADKDAKYLCVIGSRRYTPYGKEVCEYLIGGLKSLPVSIVSGLALGIDSIAHEAALANKLHTVAIPGSGLNDGVLYPHTHVHLAKRILESGGALLSEYEPNFQATDWSFPRRNRLMAGMAHATLVIEAEKKSGTLITARLAMEYNRNVCTVPGPIFSKNSEGPHYLIQNGATPIRSSDDLLEVLGLEAAGTAAEDIANLSPEEKEIVKILENNPLGKNELVEQTGMVVQQLYTLLSMMEIKGIIKEELGKIYINMQIRK